MKNRGEQKDNHKQRVITLNEKVYGRKLNE